MSEAKKFSLPVLIATVAGVATICSVAVALWIQFAKPSTELSATVNYGSYKVDPLTSRVITSLNAHLKSLKEYKQKTQTLSELIKDRSNTDITSLVPTFSPEQSYAYTSTTVTDSGDLGANNIILRVPNSVVSEVTFDDGSTKIVQGTPNIELGNLRPGQKINVYSWFLTAPIFIDKDFEFSLSYSDGIGNIHVQGQHGWFYTTFSSTFLQIYFALLFAWVIGFVIFTTYRHGINVGRLAAASSASEDTPPSETDSSVKSTDESEQ